MPIIRQPCPYVLIEKDLINDKSIRPDLLLFIIFIQAQERKLSKIEILDRFKDWFSPSEIEALIAAAIHGKYVEESENV